MTSIPIRATIDFSKGPVNWDVIVIGTGPAGSTAALRLAKAGIKVLLVDKSEHPRFKVCGSCVSVTGVQLLEQLGVLDKIEALRPIPIKALSLYSGERSVSLTLPGGWIISRSALDAALVECAIEAGAQYLPNTCAVVLQCDDGDSRNVELQLKEHLEIHGHCSTKILSAKCVVVADGLSGRSLEKIETMSAQIEPKSRVGLGAIAGPSSFDGKLFEPGTIYMFLSSDGYLGAVLLENGHLDVAAAVDKHFMQKVGNAASAAQLIVEQSDQGWRFRMQFLQHLAWHGTEALTRRRASLSAQRLLAIGDAAAYAEPFTGEGMTWAIASANQASSFIIDALSANDQEGFNWSRWNQIHNDLLGNRQQTSILMAQLLRRTNLVNAAVRILELAPCLAQPIVTKIHHSQSWVT